MMHAAHCPANVYESNTLNEPQKGRPEWWRLDRTVYKDIGATSATPSQNIAEK